MTDTGRYETKLYRWPRRRTIAVLVFSVFLDMCVGHVAVAQTGAPAEATVAAPTTINPRLRLDPSALRPGTLRFLTSDDNPPFNFAGPDGALAGYNIDLARAICGELKAACTVQARRPDLLVEALATGAGDALLPAPRGATDARFALTLPFLPRAARFAGRGTPLATKDATPASLAGRDVGVVAGSPYAVFLERFFPGVRAQNFPSRSELLDALAKGSVDLVFADAADLAFWLNGVAAGGCCAFVGGAFLDASLFGGGYAIAVRAADDDIRRALDSALTRLDARGVMTDLYLRYFPVPVF